MTSSPTETEKLVDCHAIAMQVMTEHIDLCIQAGHTNFTDDLIERIEKALTTALSDQAKEIERLIELSQAQYRAALELQQVAASWMERATQAESVATELRTKLAKTTDGAALIVSERRRQISEEVYTAEHDAFYIDDELVRAAICYAAPWIGIEATWPWPAKWYKPKTREHDLARAGALIAAEIDRLLHASRHPSTGEGT